MHKEVSYEKLTRVVGDVESAVGSSIRRIARSGRHVE
jgi:hypothetical protein